MKIKSLFLLFLFCAANAFSQQDSVIKISQPGSKAVVLNQSASTKSKGLMYDTELSMGVKFSTSGWGMFGDLTKRVNMDKKRMYYFELMFLKHPKELK
ncbi:MAG: hypothetical protein ACK4IY_08465, partial [Chitinophagales bacterium]